MFDDGSKLDELEMERGMISGIELSHDGELLAYSIVKWIDDDLFASTSLMSLNNDEYFNLTEHFENGNFNTELSIFVGWDKQKVFCLDLLTEDVIWEKVVASDQMISDAIIQGSDTYLLVSDNPQLKDNKWKYDNIQIIGKDVSGIEKVMLKYDIEATDIDLKVKDETSILLVDGKEILINKN
jgi:hypothetical protein